MNTEGIEAEPHFFEQGTLRLHTCRRCGLSKDDPSHRPVVIICWSCKKPLTEKLDLDLAELPNRGEPMCGACRGRDAD